MKVLVTDGDSRAALAVTRSLGRARHEVLVGAPHSPTLAQSSRYCAGRVSYPDPALEPEQFVDAMVRAVSDNGIECVLPIADITTFLVAANRRRFEPDCAVPLADAAVIDRAADKVDVTRTAARIGVPVPRSVVLDLPDDVPAHEMEFPVVVKPWRSRIATVAGWASTSVSHAANADALRRDLASRPAHEFPLLLQERIEGPGLGVFACYHRGRPIAFFSHRRIRERPPWGGVSVLSESIALPTATRDHAAHLLETLGWQGVAMVEFKLDRRDGRPKLMEVNGRFWGSLQLAIDAGVDFPAILLETVGDRDLTAHTSYRVGVRDRWLWGDFDSLLQTLRRWAGPADLRPPRGPTVAAFMKFFAADQYYDNPKWDDPWPFATETAQRLRSLGRLVIRTEPAARGTAAAAASSRHTNPKLRTRVAGRMEDTGLDADAWNALAARSTTNTVFQVHQWARAWLDVYGDAHDPYVLVAEDSKGPAAIAPLIVSRAANRPRTVRFIGSGRSDYCDFLVPADCREALPVLVGQLLDDPAWDAIDLRNVPAASATPAALAAACEERGFRYLVRDQFLCPTLLIEGHESAARRILNKPSLRRSERRIERAGAHRVRHTAAAAEIAPLLTEFFEQHVRRWSGSANPSLFLHERNRRFYRRLTEALDDTGWLLFSIVELDQRVAAFHYGFDYNRSLIWYKPSFEPALAGLSPGNLMVKHLITYALEHNRRELDFTVGDEAFKKRFTNLTRKTVRVQIHRSALGRLRTRSRDAVDALARAIWNGHAER
jgi:predicted ATP-grasp superfamily ATP-dependent carboligase/CelD/BcsL family acetyltransferase involved in cellulose biosynthesis